MSFPYIGEIRMVGFYWAPVGWALCNGQLLPISENDALFNLIGTTYGGDGVETFAVPDLQGRVPVHTGTGPGGESYPLGDMEGAETVTLTTNQIPAHSHPFLVTNSAGTQINPPGNMPGQPNQIQLYIDDVPSVPMSANAIGSWGGSQPHDNMMPFQVVNFIISLSGVYPSQS